MKTSTILLISLLLALSQSQSLSEGLYKITCVSDSNVLDNEDGWNDPGAYVILYPSGDQDNQRYTISYVSGVWGTLINERSSLAITVAGTNIGDNYTQEYVTNDDNQLFKFTPTSDGYWIIPNKASGLIMSCPDNTWTDSGNNPAVQTVNTCAKSGKFIFTPSEPLSR